MAVGKPKLCVHSDCKILALKATDTLGGGGGCDYGIWKTALTTEVVHTV